ncbi:MAG: hypothetical protein HY540_04330, partial [Deltaproteobacteria bacterium]|nr:hypothetical protein [Deltaproteobacteria bacterium]
SQVLIEAKILESTRSFSRALGIQWGFTPPGSRVAIQGVNAVGTADSGRTLMTNFPATSPTSGLGLVIGRIADGSNLDIQLSAAEQRGDVYVISDPSIVTSNGMSAKIRSGTKLLINAAGNINIGTEGSAASGGSGGAGLQEVETGVELNVTPQISQNHYVKLTISAITSQPDFSRAVQGIPTIIDNTAQTTVLVRDGETTVIGGLSKFSENIQDKRVPGFSRLPIMGNLFRSKDKRLENTELMVFVKPSIVKGDSLAPAQVRVHEVEERRQMMQLEPLVNPKKAKAKTVSENRRASRGNKYIQHRPPADQEVKKEK